MPIKIEPNPRGFMMGEFIDRYGAVCSIQKSSIATENCIWLGVDDANPQIMGKRGWEDFKIPEEVSLTTRMHLTRENVEDLIPLLQKFVDTGEI